jgi:hypothetical protein
VEEVNGRIPVISGTGFNYKIGVELAEQAAGAGADAILALPPYYPNSDDSSHLDYYAAIGDATSLPLFVYSRDWVNPTPAWVKIGHEGPYFDCLERWARGHTTLPTDHPPIGRPAVLDRRHR